MSQILLSQALRQATVWLIMTLGRKEPTVTLKQILSRTIQLLAKSQPSDWTPFSPEEVTEDLLKAVRAIDEDSPVDKNTLKMHFTPTGPLQEIAMSNDWTNEYLQLADHFDKKINLA